MQDKARIYSFATKKTDYQALVDDRWFPERTDTVLVTGGYLGFLGQLQVNFSSQSNFSMCNYEDGYIWDFDVDDRDEEVVDWESLLIDTIVTIDTEGIFGRIVN